MVETEKRADRASIDSEVCALHFASQLVCFGTRLCGNNKEAVTYVTVSLLIIKHSALHQDPKVLMKVAKMLYDD